MNSSPFSTYNSQLLEETASLRCKCYRSMFLMDSDYLEDYTALISEVSAACKQLVATESNSPYEEAIICLTVLVGYNVTIRNEANIKQTIIRAKAVLPKIADDRLKAHLMIYIYGETEEEPFAEEARRLLAQYPGDSLTQEDKWALQSLEDITHQLNYSVSIP